MLLSHVLQSWSYGAYTKVKRVAGRILEVEGSSQNIFISIDRRGVIYVIPLPVSSIPWEEPVNLAYPLHLTVPHFARGKRAAQVLANPSVGCQGRGALEA
ncbi:unnamed protein product [Prunus armeniaca]